MSTSTRHLIHDYGTIIDLQRHTVQFCTDMRSFIRYQITHLSSLQKVERLFLLLRATSGACNPNLNIGYKRMRGSYIALQ